MQFVTRAVWLCRHFTLTVLQLKLINLIPLNIFHTLNSCYGIKREANRCLWNYNDRREKGPFTDGSGEG